MYFAAGRWDINSPTVLAEKYYQVLEAPSKEFRWFEHAGHGVMINQPEEFIDYMVNTVLAQTLPKQSTTFR